MRKTCLPLLCILMLLSACSKLQVAPGGSSASTPPPVVQTDGTLTLDIDHPGGAIPKNFEGLSFENWILSRNPEYLDPNNAVMLQLIKNLGPGVIRMGGNSSDETDWTGDGFNANTTYDVLTPAGIQKLAQFSAKTNWPVIFGLNLGHDNINASVDESAYLYQQLGASLYALQIGNEPDYFTLGYRPAPYTVQDYENDWSAYFAPIKALVPQAQFAGPDISDALSWVQTFGADDGKNVILLDSHYYNDGPATDSSINCQTILSTDPTLQPYLQGLNNSAMQAGLGYRITETNSIWGGGKPGVSDAFAGTLWALDLMWTVASNNGQGVNFHGGELDYTPIAVSATGQCTANAVYYAMLAFKYGATGGMMVSVNAGVKKYNYNAYACKVSDGYLLTIINKELQQNISLTVSTGKTIATTNVMSLTAPFVNLANGITFAGAAVKSDGSFLPASTATTKQNSSSFVITVPAASAVVVKIN